MEDQSFIFYNPIFFFFFIFSSPMTAYFFFRIVFPLLDSVRCLGFPFDFSFRSHLFLCVSVPFAFVSGPFYDDINRS